MERFGLVFVWKDEGMRWLRVSSGCSKLGQNFGKAEAGRTFRRDGLGKFIVSACQRLIRIFASTA